jgi:hypothetical protein
MREISPEEFDSFGASLRAGLERFQQPDRLFADFTRRLGFEAFVLFCLDVLQASPHIQIFGYKVRSKVHFEYDDFGAPMVTITQTPTVICESTIPVLRNYAELYSEIFPFSTVLEGEYAVSRADTRAQEYLQAAAEQDQNRRRAIVAILGAEAEGCFRSPVLEIVIRGATPMGLYSL